MVKSLGEAHSTRQLLIFVKWGEKKASVLLMCTVVGLVAYWLAPTVLTVMSAAL